MSLLKHNLLVTPLPGVLRRFPIEVQPFSSMAYTPFWLWSRAPQSCCSWMWTLASNLAILCIPGIPWSFMCLCFEACWSLGGCFSSSLVWMLSSFVTSSMVEPSAGLWVERAASPSGLRTTRACPCSVYSTDIYSAYHLLDTVEAVGWQWWAGLHPCSLGACVPVENTLALILLPCNRLLTFPSPARILTALKVRTISIPLRHPAVCKVLGT